MNAAPADLEVQEALAAGRKEYEYLTELSTLAERFADHPMKLRDEIGLFDRDELEALAFYLAGIAATAQRA